MVGVRFEPELSLKLGSSAEGGASSTPRDEIAKKPMTIFFNGEMRVLDVIEAQARVIIRSAMNQIKNEKKSQIQECNTNNERSEHKHEPSQNVSMPSLTIPPPIQPSELSMKQSLQRFLQKRKARMATASPYSQKQLLSLSLS